MNYYLDVLKKYAVFTGRATRKEYWMFYLLNTIIMVSLILVVGIISKDGWSTIIAIVLYISAVFIPSIAVAVRRLHDTNLSGWWVLINLIPTVGGIVFIVLMVLDSQHGTNQYGPNPKETISSNPGMTPPPLV
ncbi:MAG: DUF805 domain-containing protein [bacterium]|nr:DUF805 domain-containing protein [bacterium]